MIVLRVLEAEVCVRYLEEKSTLRNECRNGDLDDRGRFVPCDRCWPCRVRLAFEAYVEALEAEIAELRKGGA